MDNYYEECLQEICKQIEEGQAKQAEMMLRQELSMPYVPEPYATQFQDLLSTLDTAGTTTVKLEDFDSLVKHLSVPSEAQVYALMQLQKMNLHSVKDEMTALLSDASLSLEVKKHLILLAMEQKLDIPVKLTQGSESYTVQTAALKLPHENEAYQQIYAALCDHYESNNPSLLTLSIEVLDGLVFDAFPFWDDALDVDMIINKIERYFEDIPQFH